MSNSDILNLLQSISSRLNLIEEHIGIQGSSQSKSSSSNAVEIPRSLRAFDSFCTESLVPFVNACTKLGGDAATAGRLVTEAFSEIRILIEIATACKEPSQAQLTSLIAPLGRKMKSIGDLTKRNEWEKHTKTVSEGMGCVNWVVVKPAPVDFIETFIGGSDYWANNIRREYRTTNPDQIAFCDGFKKLLIDLMAYVKQYHTTGLSWNARGVDVEAYKANANNASKATATTPAAATTNPSSSTTPAATGSKAVDLAAAINKGGNITAGLKTVTKDQQTWRSEFKGGDAPVPPAATQKRAGAATPAAAPQVKGPPRLEYLSGPAKWCVENQTNENGIITVNITDKKQTVYILGCVGASISVVGKCKSIIVDNCKKTSVAFDTVMASCEVVNSLRIKIECREKASSVAIDKTDGIVVQLPLTSLDTSVVASKSSEMNITWPDANGDLVEKPIPEQYVHRISGNSITADVSDLYGH